MFYKISIGLEFFKIYIGIEVFRVLSNFYWYGGFQGSVKLNLYGGFHSVVKFIFGVF